MESTLDSIIRDAKTYLIELDEMRVRRAYELAAVAHEGQVRFSGDPYITHPLEATRILLSLKPDEDTIIATLLHDVPSDTVVPLSKIEQDFGRTVASLVQGTERLSLVKVQQGEAQVESWRRMFLAMAKDMRVVFIKLAERLHNMQTLEHVATQKQRRIAEETLRVYAPIASRLGIYSIKSQLEDLCFKVLYPKEYALIEDEIESHGQVSQRYIEEAQRVLSDFLKSEDTEAEVSGRVKHMYSIYRKLRKKNATRLSDVHDLFAVRIILPDQHREKREFLGHCYTVLGALHNRWTPMAGRFKDYIAVPKVNGYRSLHTTVLNLLPDMPNQAIEIQIRTQSMHSEAEFGVASHWWYEDSRRTSADLSREDIEAVLRERRLLSQFYDLLESYPERRAEMEKYFSPQIFSEALPKDAAFYQFLQKGGFSDSDIWALRDAVNPRLDSPRNTFFHHQVDWLYGLEKLQDEIQMGNEDGEDQTSINLFEDRIFILTPQGEVKDLPVGATPVDFAYAIHSNVGNACHQAKVNGQIVSLDSELKSGDIVEVLTRKEPQPNRYWLSFVKTSQAKNKIKSWFRTVDRDKNIKAGRDMLNKELKRLGKPMLGPHFRLLEQYGGSVLDLPRREHLVESVGNGTLTINHVVRTLFSEEDLLGERVERALGHKPEVIAVSPEESKGILITGEDKLPITLSACCKPHYPDPIMGFVSRGRTIRVHKRNCKELSGIDPERFLEASWASEKSAPHYQVRLRLQSHDRVGLMRDLVAVVADMGVSILDFPLISKEELQVVRDLIVEISNYDSLARLLYRLEKVDGVESVKKV